MRKLKDDKKIKWKEAYTEKTQYFKDMYHASVGPNSYYRFEGKQMDGPGEWYVVISPSDTHDFDTRWFAGIRKLPNKWPAGGQKFDNIVDAMNYATETWGTPKPKTLPHYSTQDLKGLESRVNKWKAEREKSDKVEKKETSFSVTVLKKEAMPQAAVVKGGLTWHYSDFEAMFRDDEGKLIEPFDSDMIYAKLMSEGRSAIRSFSDYNSAESLSDEDFIKGFIASVKEASPVMETFIPPSTDSANDVMSGKARGARYWDKDNLILKPVIESLNGGPSGDYAELEASTFFLSKDKRLAVAAVVAVLSRERRSTVSTTMLNSGMEIPDNARPLALRGNFEEGLEALHVETIANKAAYKFKYGIEDSVPESDYPINNFLEYSKVDSGSRVLFTAPYTSKRNFKAEYSIDNTVLNSGEYVRLSTSLFGDAADEATSYLRQLGNFGKNIKRERMNTIVTTFLRHMDDTYFTSGAVSNADNRKSFMGLFTGCTMPIAYDSEGSVVSVRSKSGNHKARVYESLGAFYCGSLAITDGLKAGYFPSKFIADFNNADEVILASSSKVAAGEELADKLNRKLATEGSQSANDPKAVDLIARVRAEAIVTPYRFKEMCTEAGVPIQVCDIFELFKEADPVEHLINKSVLDGMESLTDNDRRAINAATGRTEDGTPADHISTMDMMVAIMGTDHSAEDISDIIREALEKQGEGVSSILEGLGTTATLTRVNNNRGANTIGVNLAPSGYLKLLKGLYGTVWGLKESMPELYKRILINYLTPSDIYNDLGMNGINQILDRADGISEYEHTIDSYLNNPSNSGRIGSINDFVANKEQGNRHPDSLLFAKSSQSQESRLNELQTEVLKEVTKYATLGLAPLPGFDSDDSAAVTERLGDAMTYKLVPGFVSNLIQGSGRTELPPGGVVVYPDDTYPGSHFLANGSPAPIYAYVNGQLFPVNVKDLEPPMLARDQRGESRKVKKALKDVYKDFSVKMPFPEGVFKKYKKGAQSPTKIDDRIVRKMLNLGDDDDLPLLDEMLSGANTYKEFMRNVALGLHSDVTSIPVQLTQDENGNPDVSYNFEFPPAAAAVSGTFLSQKYTEKNGELANLSTPISEIMGHVVYTNDNLKFLSDRVMEEGFWWRRPGDEPMQLLAGGRSVPVREFMDITRARLHLQVSNSGTSLSRSVIATTAELAVETAKKIIKNEIFTDIRAGRLNEILTGEVLEDASAESHRLIDQGQEGNPDQVRAGQNIQEIANLQQSQQVIVDSVEAVAVDSPVADQVEEEINVQVEEEVQEETGIDLDINDEEEVAEEEVAEEEDDVAWDDLDDISDDASGFGSVQPESPAVEEPEPEEVVLPQQETPSPEEVPPASPSTSRPSDDDDDDDDADIDWNNPDYKVVDPDDYFSKWSANVRAITIRAKGKHSIMKGVALKLAKLSVRLAKEGKVRESSEINQIIRRYIAN